MSGEERLRFVESINWPTLDTATFLGKYRPMLAIAVEQKDAKTEWLLRFKHFRSRDAFGLSEAQKQAEAGDLLARARAAKLREETVVAEHYTFFQRFNDHKASVEQTYLAVLNEVGQIEEVGFERFRRFDLPRMLYHDGRFLLQLDDFDKALHVLLAAEQCLVDSQNDLQTTVFVLNHIQSAYQSQKDWAKGIEYARKILDKVNGSQSTDANSDKFCHQWRGIASIDIAQMLVGEGRFEEGEQFADEGYRLLRVADCSDAVAVKAEFDMLQPLIATKLELGKLAEAGSLLGRARLLADSLVGKWEPDHFLRLRLMELSSQFSEKKGDFAAAVRWASLARPLRDSLDRRNDARKLEKIKQRLDAEKYAEQIRLVEGEKQMQTWLRNLALLILVLTVWVAWANFRRVQAKRRLALAELEAARRELADFAQNFKVKSELAENLRLEMEKLSGKGERSQYLEQLTNSVILTEEDWSRFKSVFEKVHPDFIAEQRGEHPDLTAAEVRYLVLEKLGLSTHEMANMLGVSDGTIRQTRLRLRRKIGG